MQTSGVTVMSDFPGNIERSGELGHCRLKRFHEESSSNRIGYVHVGLNVDIAFEELPPTLD